MDIIQWIYYPNRFAIKKLEKNSNAIICQRKEDFFGFEKGLNIL